MSAKRKEFSLLEIKLELILMFTPNSFRSYSNKKQWITSFEAISDLESPTEKWRYKMASTNHVNINR
jgi:hypothetical protein